MVQSPGGVAGPSRHDAAPPSRLSWLIRNRVVRDNLLRQPSAIQILRIILALCVYSIELGTFWPYARRCRNELSKEAANAPIQILVLADPQILTGNPHPSYSNLALPILPLLSTFTDRFLQRVWRALRRPGGKGPAKDWTATVWLGDLTDMGRLFYLNDDLPGLYDRFHRLFPTSSGDRANRTFYTPGNHDVTLDPPPSWQPPRGKHLYWQLQTREYTRWKFKDMFGTPVYDLGWTADSISPPLASLSQSIVRPDTTESQLGRYSTREEHTTRRAMHARVPINVTLPDGSGPATVAELILLDTTDVVSLQRMGRDPYAPGEPPMGKPGAEADWRFGGAWWFLDSLAKTQDKAVPRILFTHVPLWRDPQDKTSCDLPQASKEHPRHLPAGVTPVEPASIRRVSSAPRIVPGTNAEGTYENLVGQDWSRFILEKVQPSVIFTADDHDVCHHLHRNVSTGSSASSSSSSRFRVRNSTLDIPELTVPALSLTSGVKRPGFARLSMWQEQQQTQRQQPSVRPQMRTEYLACELPPQLAMWALWYPFVVVVVGLILWLRSRRAAAAAAASRGRARGSAMAALAQSAKSALGKASSRGYRDNSNGGRDVESVPLTTLGKRSGEKGHDVDEDGSSEKGSDESDSDTLSSGEASDGFEDTDEEERMVRSPETGELVFEYRDDDGSGDSSPPAYTQGSSVKNGKGKRKSGQGRGSSRRGGHGAAASGSSGSSGSGAGSRGHSRRASRASNNAIFVLDDEDGGGGDVEKVASSSSSRLDDSKERTTTTDRSQEPSRRRRRRRGRRRLDTNDRFVTFAPWWSPTAWLIAPLRRKTRALVSRGRSGGRRGGHRGEGDGVEIMPEIVAAPPPAFLVDLLVVAWPPTLFWILLWLLGL